MMATAFMGYVLPWGQMSFWGATVITNLFTAIPFVGESIAVWLWGGYSVDNATLNRFFSLHYLLPFLIIGVVFLHLLVLHTVGSGQPLQVNDTTEFIPFYPYYFYKDLVSFFCFWMFFFNTVIFGLLGAQPVEYPYIQIGMCATFYYFFHFFFVIPGLTFLEIYALALLKKK